MWGMYKSSMAEKADFWIIWSGSRVDHNILWQSELYKAIRTPSVSWMVETHWDQILIYSRKSPRRRSKAPVYPHRWAYNRYPDKASVHKKICIFPRQIGDRGNNSLSWKGRNDSLGWEGALTFYWIKDSHFQVWKMVHLGKFLSSFGKWFEISDGQAFSSSKNGPDRTIIFVMKMVQ